MENTPLGRAEWIRVIGMLAGCEDKADAWFDDIERRYNALSTLCAEVEHRPTVFSDLAFNGQWYVAGGRSYMAKLFADAGADYIWKDNPSTASVPMDAESILRPFGATFEREDKMNFKRLTKALEDAQKCANRCCIGLYKHEQVNDFAEDCDWWYNIIRLITDRVGDDDLKTRQVINWLEAMPSTLQMFDVKKRDFKRIVI